MHKKVPIEKEEGTSELNSSHDFHSIPYNNDFQSTNPEEAAKRCYDIMTNIDRARWSFVNNLA